MTAIGLRSEIMQLLRGETNTAVLEAIRMLLRIEEGEEEKVTDK